MGTGTNVGVQLLRFDLMPRLETSLHRWRRALFSAFRDGTVNG